MLSTFFKCILCKVICRQNHRLHQIKSMNAFCNSPDYADNTDDTDYTPTFGCIA